MDPSKSSVRTVCLQIPRPITRKHMRRRWKKERAYPFQYVYRLQHEFFSTEGVEVQLDVAPGKKSKLLNLRGLHEHGIIKLPSDALVTGTSKLFRYDLQSHYSPKSFKERSRARHTDVTPSLNEAVKVLHSLLFGIGSVWIRSRMRH